jgi:hypothetical protein
MTGRRTERPPAFCDYTGGRATAQAGFARTASLHIACPTCRIVGAWSRKCSSPSGVRMPQLRVIVGPDVGKMTQVEDAPVLIGRGDDCELCLSDQHVSVIQAVVEPFDPGWRVRDLETADGTAVNGALIQDHPLTFGDIIKVGVTLILFGSGHESVDATAVGSAELPLSNECNDGSL